jgi:predicted nucleotidyltransferase
MDLQEHTILLTVSGSRAYGTHTDTSDLDVRGVMIPPAKYYMGLSRIEQVTDKLLINTSFLGALTDDLRAVALAFGMEGTVFELHKFIRLAADGNPNILDALFCRDEDIIWMSREGLRLRENKERFLTKKCLLTFFGYAKQQLDRIETHRGYLLDKPTKMPTREDFGLPARHSFPQDQVNAAMALVKQKVDSWNIDFLDVDEATKIYVQDQLYKMLTEMSLGLDERHRAAARLLGYDSNFMEFIVQQRNYNAAMGRWNSYQKWLLERNKERAGMESEIGYDAKHGMHLARLVMACRTIFETGTLCVYNPDPWLRDIRDCKVPFAELQAWYEDQKSDLAAVAAKSSLPDRVPQVWLGDFAEVLVRTHCHV